MFWAIVLAAAVLLLGLLFIAVGVVVAVGRRDPLDRNQRLVSQQFAEDVDEPSGNYRV